MAVWTSWNRIGVFAALPQPLEVREVGGDTILESLAGPALIAVAAILAAFLAVRRPEEPQQRPRGVGP